MQLDKNKNTNLDIAQLRLIIARLYLNYKDQSCIGWNLKRGIDINQRVLATKYLETIKSKLIDCTALDLAYLDKNITVFAILLKYGANFTSRNQKGFTVIHRAIRQVCVGSGNKWILNSQLKNDFIDAVLDAHIKFKNFSNPCDNNGISHFHAACMSNNKEAVEFFLQNGTSVDQSVEKSSPILAGYTPLHFAVKCCSIEAVKILLKYGANVNSRDANGMTPLYVLINEKMEIIKKRNKQLIDVNDELIGLLLGDNVGCRNDIDVNGLSTLHVACVMKNIELVKKLLKRNADINHFVHLDSPIWPGYTALHFAAYCNFNIFQLLVEEGADIGLKNHQGVTLFDMCLYKIKNIKNVYGWLESNPSWNKIILSDGKTKLLDIIESIGGKRSLYFWVKRGEVEPACISDVNLSIPSDSQLWSGYTILHLAVLFVDNNSTEEIGDLEQLLRRGADICEKDSRGWTPLHFAARLQKDNFVRKMLKYHHKAINLIDEDGMSHLHIACTCRSKSLIEKLLSTETDVNIVYRGKSLSLIRERSTPLHVALCHKRYDVATVLLAHGANAYAKDINNMTPLHHLLFDRGPESLSKSMYEVLFSNSDLRTNFYQRTGLDLLHITCSGYSRNVLLVEQLLDAGANVNQVFNNKDISIYTEYTNFTPLNFALSVGSVEIVGLLISRGANLFFETPVLFERFPECFLRFSECLEILVRETKYSATLKRFEKDLNLTPLHVACWNIDVDMIKNLLKTDLDVNAQIHSNSPIWPKFTALHVLLFKYFRRHEDINRDEQNFLLDSLIDKGADVTLTNTEDSSPLTMAFSLLGHLKHSQLSKMLKSQSNFQVNPVDNNGISHLHIACFLGETTIVRKFLDHGADVNEKTDIFYSYGPSLLHTAVDDQCRHGGEVSPQAVLETVRVLLEYGADFSVVDGNGNNPLHIVVNKQRGCMRESLIEEMINYGCDVSAKNLNGETAFEILLRWGCPTVKEFKSFMKRINNLNIYNPVTEKGLLGMVFGLCINLYEAVYSLIKGKPQIARTDDLGRTAIHNICSFSGVVTLGKEFYLDIEKFVDCDINAKDELGRTALHFAIKNYSSNGISQLLDAGANVNAIDANGDAPLHIAMWQSKNEIMSTLLEWGADVDVVDARGRTPLRIATEAENSEAVIELLSNGADVSIKDIDGETPMDYTQKNSWFNTLINIFAEHIYKLRHCGFDLNWINLDSCLPKHCNYSSPIFERQLEDTKSIEIEPYSLSLHDYFSKIDAMINDPYASQLKCFAINEFFESNENPQFRENFSEIMPALKLLRRKALKVLKLIDDTKTSLEKIAGLPMPDLCFQAILKYLDNASMNNLIDSTVDL